MGEFTDRLFRSRHSATVSQARPAREGELAREQTARVDIKVTTAGGMYRPTADTQIQLGGGFRAGDGESAGDAAVRGLEQLYWRIVQNLADSGSRRAKELVSRGEILAPISMTQDLAIAVGAQHRPELEWDELLELAGEKVEAHHKLRALLAGVLWVTGWQVAGDPDVADEDLVAEVVQRARRRVHRLNVAVGQQAAKEYIEEAEDEAFDVLIRHVEDLTTQETRRVELGLTGELLDRLLHNPALLAEVRERVGLAAKPGEPAAVNGVGA
jgi:hypothetical protein